MSFNSSSRLDFLSYVQLLFYPDVPRLSEQMSDDGAEEGATGRICTVRILRKADQSKGNPKSVSVFFF